MKTNTTHIEITGWNADDESVEDSGMSREGESEDVAVARMIARTGIIEIGEVRINGS